MHLRDYTTGDFERGRPFWVEALWMLVRALFFLNPWPWPSSVRVGRLRAFGAKIGEGVVIRAQVNITFPWRLTVGDYVWLGDEVLILSLAPVLIESHVCISQRAFLCTGSHDFRAPGFDLITKPITVRTGSWIAAQVFVGPGVEIGAGSVVSAGSIVTRSIPADVLVAGNPASVVKTIR